jgi:hypothetical protein
MVGTASGATRTLTFTPQADALIRADRPTRSYGGSSSLTVDNSPVTHTLIRFAVSGVGTDVVSGATLRLFTTNGSPAGGTVFRVASLTWAETVTWNSAPVADPTPITTAGAAIANAWTQFDLTKLVTGDGTYSVRITSPSTDGATYVSREGAASQRPQLVVTTAPPPDATPPTVSISSPADGTTVGGTVTVAATATDDTGVTAVDVAVDGATVGTDTTAPYEVPWDTGASANGSHALTAIAHDAAGHATTSAPVGVTVSNVVDTSPPSAPGGLTGTADGPTSVTLTWSASHDDVGVTGYEVAREGTVLGTVTTLGYADAAAPAGATVHYTVVALDAVGHRSDPATTAVDTPSPPPPTSFSFAAAGDHGASARTSASLAALDASPASFYLALGDMDYDETPTDVAWFDYVHQHLPAKGASFPFEVVTGNHEDDVGPNGSILNFAGCLPDHANAIAGPGSQYGVEYAFDYPAGAPLARVLMLSPGLTVGGTTYRYTAGSPEYQWVSDTIDQARGAGIPWVIVGFHFPCLTAGVYQCASGPALMNLLVGKHVDLVLHGHEHSYQRGKQLALDPTSCPAIAGTGYNPACVVDDGIDGVYPQGAGTVDVISGTFGRSPYQVSRTDPEAPYFATMDGTSNGFMRYDVTADRIDATFVRTAGTFGDAFSIVRGATASADTVAPSQPADLAADTSTPGRVNLTWSASADDHGVSSYAVSRDGVVVGSSATTTFSDPSVTSGQSYTYTVTAYDTAFNPSPASAGLAVTVPLATTLAFAPDADATIRSDLPANAYGTATTLQTDGSPVKDFLIRFTVSGVGAQTVTNAKLRLSCVDNSPSGGTFTASANTWTESTVTWNTAPPPGATIATLGKVVAGSTYEVDLSSLIHGDGTYTLRVSSANSDGADYTSREGTLAARPQLVLTVG